MTIDDDEPLTPDDLVIRDLEHALDDHPSRGGLRPKLLRIVLRSYREEGIQYVNTYDFLRGDTHMHVRVGVYKRVSCIDASEADDA